MILRAQQLQAAADRQIAELAEQLSTAGEQALARPCPGRARLGDGSVGAVAAHTTDNYHRTARFVSALRDGGKPHERGQHGEGYRASEIKLDVLLVRLAAARDALATIGRLSEERLEAVPPAGEIKFADGDRTLEDVLASLLKHQRHQVDALVAALSRGPRSR
jgi:hypothetical protein